MIGSITLSSLHGLLCQYVGWDSVYYIYGNNYFPVADLRGNARDARLPPLGQNFFIFMQFSGKIRQIVGWFPPPLGLAHPLRQILDPPLQVPELSPYPLLLANALRKWTGGRSVHVIS